MFHHDEATWEQNLEISSMGKVGNERKAAFWLENEIFRI